MGQFIDRESDGEILVGCSICGNIAWYPSEFRYRADRLFWCYRHSDTTTSIEEARKAGQVRSDRLVPGFPIGPKPTGHESE